ncbi:MAG: DUF1501 domain-containing protein [Acidobacteria bacterium]|nr:DUF1501 domain-containing protein [Acidobacteriota bacterium]
MKRTFSRRELLQTTGAGFGLLGLAAQQALAGSTAPMAPRAGHFPAKAKRVIYLFLNGGISQVDSFDPKPMLTKMHGQPLPGPKFQTDRASGNLMQSPFEFRPQGKSGLEVSSIFPRVGAMIDDFCVIRSMYSDNGNHGPSLLLMNTGHQLAGRPSMGSWLTYGLGSENQNLPGFVALCAGHPVLGAQLWDSGFLPSIHQGAYIPLRERTPDKLVQNIRNNELSAGDQQRQLGLLDRLNRGYLARTGNDVQLESSIQAMEMAFRMQTEAPDVFDLGKESEATRERYGDHEFGRGCLMALRLAERGVRVSQVYFGNFQPWDSHDDILVHRKLAAVADRAISSLVTDLKARGLWEDTVLLIGSEFGRTPMIQNSGLEKVGYGRDHNVHGYTVLMAGGGVRGGMAYGATDDFGYRAVEKRTHPHDLHATVLHLMGVDHTRLTYRYAGRDFRLTDVAGTVIRDILA